MMIPEFVMNFAKDNGYDGAEFIEKWKEYDVYQPTFANVSELDSPVVIGYPHMILVKGNRIRMSTLEETEEYFGGGLVKVS